MINWNQIPKSVNCVLLTSRKLELNAEPAFYQIIPDGYLVGIERVSKGCFKIVSDDDLTSYTTWDGDIIYDRASVEYEEFDIPIVGFTKPEPIDLTLSERGSRYGRFEDGAEIMQYFKDYARTTPGWNKMKPIQRESLDMIFHKIGRILNGDPDYADSWHDVCGFSKLVDDYLNGVSK